MLISCEISIKNWKRFKEIEKFIDSLVHLWTILEEKKEKEITKMSNKKSVERFINRWIRRVRKKTKICSTKKQIFEKTKYY